MSAPTRLLSGVATVPASEPLGNYPFPDPFHTSGSTGLGVTSYVDDFFSIDDWTIVGSSSTFATADGLGGVALVTPGGTTTATTIAKDSSGFQLISGNKFWYGCRTKMSAITSTKAFVFGLQKGAGANASATDGLWFTKPASSTSLNLVSKVDGTATTLVTGVTTVVADTFLDVAFYYDGTDILVYSAGVVVGRVSAPTIGATATTLTNELLNVVFNVVPTATDTLSIDYVLAAQEVTR